MALPGFRNHPKFRRLVAALRIPEPHALGHIEMMWEVAYENGNAVLGDAVDVELAAGWTGEPGALCRALLECGGKTRAGLIDEIEEGVFQVHDLLDHAPDYVENRRKRLEEKGKDKVCGHCGATFRTSDPRSRFCSDACRKADWRKRHKTEGETDGDGHDPDATSRERTRDGHETDRDGSSDHYQPSPVVHTPNGVCGDASAPPPPAPPEERIPKAKKPKAEKLPKAKPMEERTLEEILGGKGSQAWERFWKTMQCWNRDKVFAPKKLAVAWLKACERTDPKSIYLGALSYRDEFLPPRRGTDETHFMKNPLEWLEQEGWTAEPIEPELAEVG